MATVHPSLMEVHDKEEATIVTKPHEVSRIITGAKEEEEVVVSEMTIVVQVVVSVVVEKVAATVAGTTEQTEVGEAAVEEVVVLALRRLKAPRPRRGNDQGCS
jgi:hypothetical protein